MATRTGARDTSPANEPAFPRAGFRIGEYVIENMLGHGSMSTVFLAHDATGHEVALKVFQEGPNVSDVMRERFRREIEASKKLRNHPNIMTVYATGKDGPFHYIAMQRILENKTVETLIEREVLSVEQVVTVFIKIARALAYAHERRILHRDVKPSNIMIDRFGEPLLADFGVAVLLEWPRFTVAGALTGTPLYMSPEQANGELMDCTSDLYSLGVVLFETLTGVLPYSAHRASSLKDTLRAVQNESVRRPRLFREEISPELDAVILKALARDPTERYPNGTALADDLQRALRGESVEAPLYSRVSSFVRIVNRHRRDLAAAAALLGLLLGLSAYFLSQLRDMQYQALAGLAQLQNSEYKLESLSRSGATPMSSALTLERFRMARDLMTSEAWDDAAALLGTVEEQSRRDGDTARETLASLERARCATMLEQEPEAFQRYSRIVNTPDTTPSIAGLAQLEASLLAVRIGRPDALAHTLDARTIPSTHPVSGALDIARGELVDPDQIVEHVERLPDYLRNDTYFAAGMMALQRDDTKGAQRFLQLSINVSASRNEWPAPWARKILSEIAP